MHPRSLTGPLQMLVACTLLFTAWNAANAQEDEASRGVDTDQSAAPEAQASSGPEVIQCYLAVEFRSEKLTSTLVRVDVDGEVVDIYDGGARSIGKYPEGMHAVSIAHPRASKKRRKANTFALELKPYAYTKILIEETVGAKKTSVDVVILVDDEAVGNYTLDVGR